MTIFFSNFKNKTFTSNFKKDFFKKILGGMNNFFSRPEVANFIINVQTIPIYLYQKIVIYCIPPPEHIFGRKV
jgi:hypothetical protein